MKHLLTARAWWVWRRPPQADNPGLDAKIVEADGMPASLHRPPSWSAGCTYPGEPFVRTCSTMSPWQEITDWRNAGITCLMTTTG